MTEPVDRDRIQQPMAVAACGGSRMGELEVLIRARYPLLYVVSWEEQRVLGTVLKIAAELDKKVFEWSATTGLVMAGVSIQSKKNRNPPPHDPQVAQDNVIDMVEPALYEF